MIGAVQTFIIQSFRQVERGGEDSKSKDTLFMQYVDDVGHYRLVIPHRVIDAIVRQREALGGKTRRTAAKAEAARRKAAGIKPGFMKGKDKP
jgi:hypothetical protein